MDNEVMNALAVQAQSISDLQQKVDHLLKEMKVHDRRIDGLANATGTSEADHHIEHDMREEDEVRRVPPYLDQ